MAASERPEVILLVVSTILSLIGAVSALLALALFLQKRKRAPRCAEEIDWIGQGFDPAPVGPRLQAVRHDYVREVRARPRPCAHSPAAVAAARELVAGLPYFQTVEANLQAAAEEPASPGTCHASLP